jgi:hypothetical protein
MQCDAFSLPVVGAAVLRCSYDLRRIIRLILSRAILSRVVWQDALEDGLRA